MLHAGARFPVAPLPPLVYPGYREPSTDKRRDTSASTEDEISSKKTPTFPPGMAVKGGSWSKMWRTNDVVR